MSTTQKRKSFLILFDSLSALQAIHNLKYDHPVLIKIHELYSQLIQEKRGTVFVWVPGPVGIRGNSAADSAAKDALDGDISDEFIPFSDLKPRLNNYIFELWQRQWDEIPRNKLHTILPSFLFNQTRRDCSFLFTCWSLTRNSFILVEGRGATLLCLLPRTPFIATYFTFLFGSDWFRQKHFNVKSLKVLFKKVSSDIIFNFLKEVNIFYKL